MYTKFGCDGVVVVMTYGPAEYRRIAEQCLRAGVCNVFACVNRDVYAAELKRHGVPEKGVRQILDSLIVRDGTFLVPRNGRLPTL